MNETHLTYLASPEWAQKLETDLLPWIEAAGEIGDDVLEIGPGPGLTTDILRRRARQVTAVEIDEALATALTGRLGGTNVEVVHGDATGLAFESGRFSSAAAFAILHHVPTAEDQDRILREVVRVLAPGARLFATDARDVDAVRGGHQGDTFNPLPLDDLVSRLERVGFEDVQLDVADYEIRFSARRPA